ncbi:MAG: ATP-binding protein [Deltaproteobacteria bacterium]|nr:ATP-binding protein [Deltaproteobacteria bacterium]
MIVEEVERIDARIRELLDRTRDPVEAPSACSVNELLERAVLLVAGDTSRGKAVRFVSDLAATEALPPLALRRRALEGAFVNLLLNALDAVADEGEIRVATAVRNGADNVVEIRVSDDGRGIEPERLARIFDPFETGRAGGVGLGLGIARRAVEAERGALRIESALGRGTVATIVLPRHPTSTPEPARLT